MDKTIGKRIAELRKQQGFTQEDLAEQFGLSSQAVSKWENDLAYPDILLLPKLAGLLGITVDALLTGEKPPETRLLPEEKRKPADEMLLRIHAQEADGGTVRINIPLILMKNLTDIETINISGIDLAKQIDFNKVFELAERGLMGKLIEAEDDGDRVEIWVE